MMRRVGKLGIAPVQRIGLEQCPDIDKTGIGLQDAFCSASSVGREGMLP